MCFISYNCESAFLNMGKTIFVDRGKCYIVLVRKVIDAVISNPSGILEKGFVRNFSFSTDKKKISLRGCSCRVV
jgi:hypothetical protein